MSCERSTRPWRALATVSAMLVTRTVKRVPAGRAAIHMRTTLQQGLLLVHCRCPAPYAE